MSKRSRIAAAATAVLLLFSTTGVALAADAAVPGDALYGLDLALEKVGIGAGGLEERLDEASTLAERDEVEAGLAHATEALMAEGESDEDARDAAEALLAAADAVLSTDEGEADEVRVRVADMLRWMATTDAKGADFARGVAARASDIPARGGESPGDPSDAPAEGGHPEGVPAGKPEGVPSDAPEDTPSGKPEGAPNGVPEGVPNSRPEDTPGP